MRRNAGFAFAGQMVSSLATGVLTLYLVRAFGPKQFGLLAIAVGIAVMVLLPSDFGISSSTARFVAEQRGRWPAVGALLRNALRLKLVASGVLSVALFVLAGPIATGYGSHDLAAPLRVMAIAIFFQSFFMLFTQFFVAVGRVSFNLRLITVESLVEAVTAATLVIMGGGTAGAALGKVVGYSVASTLGLVLAMRMIGSHNLRGGNAPGAMKRIFGYAGALVVVDSAYVLMAPVGTLILGALINARAVGIYAAPSRFITFLHYPGLSIAAGVAPRLARGEGREPDTAALVTGLRWVMLIQTVLVAPTIIWARPIADILLGKGYGDSGSVLMVLAPYTFLQGFGPLVSLSVNYLGEARRRVPIALATFAISVTLDIVLIQTVGLLGAAISTDIAYAFYVGGHLWICKRTVNLPLRPVARDLVRCLLAALAMVGVMALFGTRDLGVLEIVVGGAVGVATYIGVLLATRAVTPGELRAFRGAVAGKFRRRPVVA
jgi:O-antigen/teichoic acid export membrane protein